MLNPPAGDHLWFARRRRAPARRRARQQALPDWVWGIALGVLLLAVVGGFVLISGAVGGGGSTCDEPLVPLDTSDTSAAGFAQEDTGMGKFVDLLNRGDIKGAQDSFYGPVHNFTHNADPPVRAKDEELAKELCRSVIDIEESLSGGTSAPDLVVKAQRVRNLLRDGAVALGYPRPQ